MGPPGATEADAAAAGDMEWLAAALAAGLAEGLGAAGAALSGPRTGPSVQPAPVLAGAQAANPAAATRPPPVSAALRRNLRRERAAEVAPAEWLGSVGGR
jgi:hypothetical protein